MPRWWQLGAALLILGGAAAPAASRQIWLALGFLWPALLWSGLGVRERESGVDSILAAAPLTRRRQLPAVVVSGLLAGLATTGGSLLRILFAGDLRGAAGVAAGTPYLYALLGAALLSVALPVERRRGAEKGARFAQECARSGSQRGKRMSMRWRPRRPVSIVVASGRQDRHFRGQQGAQPMDRPIAAFLVAASALLSVAAADEKPKRPVAAQKPLPVTAGPQATTVAPPPTGYDVAIVDLSSTGPQGTPANALIVRFENQGTQPLDHDLYLQVRIAGQPAMLRSVRVRLQPGARTTWTNDYQAEADLYPWGTDVWAKIDAQGALREDNERNNEMQRVLKKKTIAETPVGIRP